jgi:site-specific DNA recombinase
LIKIPSERFRKNQEVEVKKMSDSSNTYWSNIKNVILYVRVSSEKQAEKELPITAQVNELKRASKVNGWNIIKIFIDEAQSARSDRRPEFQSMIHYAKTHRDLIDAVVVWKFSRFARNREDSILYKKRLSKYGVVVISVNEKIDDSPAGRMLEGMIELVDEFYIYNLIQDVKRGLKENARKGFRNGGVPPIGYKAAKVMDGNCERSKLAPDPEHAPTIVRVFDMAAEGKGAKEIAKILNQEGVRTNRGKKWKANLINRILKNEKYIGTAIWNARDPENVIRVENNHKAIVDKETFKKVQKSLKTRSPAITHPRTINSRYILNDLLYCGRCGYKMFGAAAKSGKYHYYECGNRHNNGSGTCDLQAIPQEKLEDFVIERLKDAILTDENIKDMVELTNDELAHSSCTYQEKLSTVGKKLKSIREKLDKHYDALETGLLDINDLAPRIKDLKEQVAALEDSELEIQMAMEEHEDTTLDNNEVLSFVSDFKSLLRSGSILEQKSFIKAFVKKITVYRPKIKIEYSLPIIEKGKRKVESEVLPIDSLGLPLLYPVVLFGR